MTMGYRANPLRIAGVIAWVIASLLIANVTQSGKVLAAMIMIGFALFSFADEAK